MAGETESVTTATRREARAPRMNDFQVGLRARLALFIYARAAAVARRRRPWRELSPYGGELP